VRRYKIVILILSFLVVIETILLIRLWVIRPKKLPEIPKILKGRIAIVIDDWGYNSNNLEMLEEIKYPLTVSILPNLSYSRQLSEELHRRGLEVILHLPLEPHEKFRLEQNTVMTSMDESKIIDIIRRDLANVSNAKGVSNHMGSLATEDLRTMGIIFQELKQRRLYFLDSMVSPKSICSGLAKKMHLDFVKRDIFLDNKESPEYIRGQIYRLKVKAGLYGRAVGIGHDRKSTLEVLKEAIPQLEKEGYKLVFVSELIY
jgi:polysaccharide deacetylase 2 family uncharacterized protein YibQ